MGVDLQVLARLLIGLGAIILGLGLVLLVAPKVPWIGRLPGDILIQHPRMTLYVPLASCLLASVLLSAVLWLLGRFR